MFTNSRHEPFSSQRPAPGQRKFTSSAVEQRIKRVKADIGDPELAWLFENCYPNTLDTTVEYDGSGDRPDTFVITGDIHAMWLRDSTAQVWPYVSLAKEDPELGRLLAGVINRQTDSVLIDPYANAFNKNPGDETMWEKDLTEMKPMLHERKWEIDSLCYPIRLAHGYWKETGDTAPFDERWHQAMKLIVQTFREQQRKEDRGPYTFQRFTQRQIDTLTLSGYGRPVNPVGLICSAFRPSDDSTVFLFLIPSNLFAVRSLRQLAEMERAIHNKGPFAAECESLADEVEQAVMEHAVFDHPNHGKVLAYEVDGYGARFFMDDANIPSLLSMPYLDCLDRDDPLYINTRNLVLSPDNPYYFEGSAAKGIGSPHAGYNRIWHLSLIMQGLTSTDASESAELLEMIKRTDAGTGFMHEAFNKDDPAEYSRSWFAWANTLFGEWIVKLHSEQPELLKG